MPSLAASSSDTSPEERVEEATRTTSSQAEGQNGNAVSSLLMAAVAMTEFQSQNITSAPPSKTCQETDTAESFQEDRPGVRRVFRPSPKRKSSEAAGSGVPATVPTEELANADNETDPQSQYIATGLPGKSESSEYDEELSPVDPRELKRTRLGSVRKKMTWEKGPGHDEIPSGFSMKENESTLHETPDHKIVGPDKLTPVSARCIDFRRMNMDEKEGKPDNP